MAISYSSLAASVPNWQLLQTSTPSGVASVTFSGLSGYSKYRILAPNLVMGGTSQVLELRMNADSGSNYSYAISSLVNGSTSGRNNGGSLSTFFPLNVPSFPDIGNLGQYQFDIEHALLATPKLVTGNASYFPASGLANIFQYLGTYVTTSILTSITLLLSANNFSTGSIYLLGAN